LETRINEATSATVRKRTALKSRSADMVTVSSRPRGQGNGHPAVPPAFLSTP
jgi:hypothetical protein